MIREAGLDDLDRLLSWGREFHQFSPWRHTPYSEGAVRQILTDIFDSDTATVLMHDKGMIGGFIMPLWLAPDHHLAHELFWWAESDGGSLLDAFEDWAKSKGAKEVIMLGLHGVDGDKVKRIYTHKGYNPREYTYSKEL